MIRLLFLLTLILARPALAQVGDPSAPNAITDPLGLALAGSMPVDGPPTQQGDGWAVALWHYAQNIYTAANAKADAGVAAMQAANVNYVSPLLKDALALLLLTELIGMAVGGVDANPIGHVVKRVLRYSVIVLLVGNAGTYQQHVAIPLNGVVDDIGTHLTGALGGAVGVDATPYDNAFNSAWQAVWTVVKTTPFGEGVLRALFVYALAGAAFLITALAIAIAFITSLAAGLALKIGLAVGPLFIAGSLAPKTSALTDNWIGVVGSAAATKILAALVISLLGFADQATTGSYLQGATAAGNNPVTGVQALVAMGLTSFVLGVFVFFEAPRMAQRLFSGLVATAAPYTAAAAGAFAGVGAMASFGARGAASAASAASSMGSTGSAAAFVPYSQGGQPLSRAFQTANQAAGRARGYTP